MHADSSTWLGMTQKIYVELISIASVMVIKSSFLSRVSKAPRMLFPASDAPCFSAQEVSSRMAASRAS